MEDTGPTEGKSPDGLPGWCPVANVARETVRGEGGLDIQHGTKSHRAETFRRALVRLPAVRGP